MFTPAFDEEKATFTPDPKLTKARVVTIPWADVTSLKPGSEETPMIEILYRLPLATVPGKVMAAHLRFRVTPTEKRLAVFEDIESHYNSYLASLPK